MKHSTLAIASVALLLVGGGGPTGTAAAEPGAGTLTAQAAICEVGVDIGGGDFIELCETTGTAGFSLNGFALVGCDDTTSFTIATFDTTHTIPAGGIFLVADQTYEDADGPDRNAPFAAGADLVQSDGGVALVTPPVLW